MYLYHMLITCSGRSQQRSQDRSTKIRQTKARKAHQSQETGENARNCSITCISNNQEGKFSCRILCVLLTIIQEESLLQITKSWNASPIPSTGLMSPVSTRSSLWSLNNTSTATSVRNQHKSSKQCWMLCMTIKQLPWQLRNSILRSVIRTKLPSLLYAYFPCPIRSLVHPWRKRTVKLEAVKVSMWVQFTTVYSSCITLLI
jgi:hypothetical protein